MHFVICLCLLSSDVSLYHVGKYDFGVLSVVGFFYAVDVVNGHVFLSIHGEKISPRGQWMIFLSIYATMIIRSTYNTTMLILYCYNTTIVL